MIPLSLIFVMIPESSEILYIATWNQGSATASSMRPLPEALAVISKSTDKAFLWIQVKIQGLVQKLGAAPWNVDLIKPVS